MSPFSDNFRDSVGSLGEAALIREIRRWLGSTSPPPPEGIGDDCAVFSTELTGPRLITTDPVTYGYHFDDSVSPEDVGSKLLKRNISDVAAMGGMPELAVIALTLPVSTRLDWLERFHEGLANTAERFKVRIVGGDVTQSQGFLGAYLTLVGRAGASGRVLTRQGARVGDHLLVTGCLGGSRRGHHYAFSPRVAEGLWLGARNEIRAMIDLSDGLAKDLPSVLPNGTDATLDWDLLPVSDAAESEAKVSGKPPWFHALCDGEDYELLFAVEGENDLTEIFSVWKETFPLTPLERIGTVVASGTPEQPPAILLPPDRQGELALHGYEHLGKA